MDVFGHYRHAIDRAWPWRVGLHGYFYPGANLDHAELPPRSSDTVEMNAVLHWRACTLRWDQVLAGYFGVGPQQGNRGSPRGAVDLLLDARFALAPRWNLQRHANRTRAGTTLRGPLPDGAANPDYSDCAATLTRRLDRRWAIGATPAHTTDAAFDARTVTLQTLDTGGTRVVLTLQGTF